MCTESYTRNIEKENFSHLLAFFLFTQKVCTAVGNILCSNSTAINQIRLLPLKLPFLESRGGVR